MQTLTLSLDPCMASEKWLFPLLSVAFVSLLIFLSAISALTASSSFLPAAADLRRGPNNPASFAFYLSGARGDADRLLRLLRAVYHPRNRYLLHLSTDAPASERAYLANAARAAIPAIRAFGNVDVLGLGDAMTYMGSSGLAATLHAASVMLRLDREWNWFVTLNAADYPLVTQDDLIHVFSSVPRDLNFIDHTSDLGWKESDRVQPIVVDPGIYLARRTQIFHATEKRKTPDAFKFFTGSPWVILSRPFMEYCIIGWDNLPRTLLMYFTNVPLPEEGYFHSVVCNAPEFQNKTVNTDLRYMVWDNPPKMEPHFLNVTDFDEMSDSGVPFARQFKKDDPVLDMIDKKILDRSHYTPVPGAWCSGKRRWWTDPCSQWKDINIVKPSPWAKKLGKFMKKLVIDDWNSQLDSCNQLGFGINLVWSSPDLKLDRTQSPVRIPRSHSDLGFFLPFDSRATPSNRMMAGKSVLNPYATPYVPLSEMFSGMKFEENVAGKGMSTDFEKKKTAESPVAGSSTSFAKAEASKIGQHSGSSYMHTPFHEEAVGFEDFGAVNDHALVMETLCSMFPDISVESLAEVFHVNNGDLSETIDMLEQFEGEGFDSGDLPETSEMRSNFDPALLKGSSSGTRDTV
ncbi:hypothetical protein J5N97_027875 [Dioscorea zingiberensis]|uniref:CUE domain-containing protein n=1 Tax=Dioscorea zingiberensis TaxID=325984 RepID=A0A9D5BXW7_9LILI|nr:hypothetical protein J5N97_027875 [Dioscorea zingiberensis]